MKPIIRFCSATAIFCASMLQAQPAIQWRRCIGGADEDVASSVRQTTDGGYIVAGHVRSNDGDISGNHGAADLWATKLTGGGLFEWQYCFGGTNNEEAYHISQTLDGGYLLAGSARSNDGDLTGNHGMRDAWLVKLDMDGNLQWQRNLGGSQDEAAEEVLQLPDGSYVIAGWTRSTDGDVSGNHGNRDHWIVKLDPAGTLQWQKCYGGTNDDEARSIHGTLDGGFIVGGVTLSHTGDVSGNHGSSDAWIVKLDASGNLQWQKCLGGTGYDSVSHLHQSTDGGYIVGGQTTSNDGDVSGHHGLGDAWAVKLNHVGTVEWQKCLGGSENDQAVAVHETMGGGFIMAGQTSSDDGDVSGYHGSIEPDAWVMKLDASGALAWEKCLGNTATDIGEDISLTSDGGYIFIATVSGSGGDVTGFFGIKDLWVAKFYPDEVGILEESGPAATIAPNPAHGSVLLMLPNNGRHAELALTDALGRELRRGFLNGATHTLDVGDLARGVYVLTLRNEQGRSSQRLVLE